MTSGGGMLYIVLALPALFGLLLLGEGVYKMYHYQPGWINIVIGGVFLSVVAFGFFYLQGIG